jgi:glycosyltransferase involved in cell wall biosynthesis
MRPTACFFSNESLEQLNKEQYSIQDISILKELGYQVTVATSFGEVPFGCDLYFSWWASGSILPLVKAWISRRPIIVVAGGNEATRYRDSVSQVPVGYLAAPWYKRLATRICLRFADRVLVVSRFMVPDVLALGAKTPIVVHNSVNTSTFVVSRSPRTLVTSIFNLEESVVKLKRGEVFLRSIPHILSVLPEQDFAVIGAKSNAYERLLALACELKIQDRVEFVGSIPNAEVAVWMGKSRVYVQISDTETFGVAIAEAMSCGTPVVVSRRGAIPELVGDCGAYVDHNDPESVAAGVLRLLTMPGEEARLLGSKARQRIEEHFSYEGRKTKVQFLINNLKSE